MSFSFLLGLLGASSKGVVTTKIAPPPPAREREERVRSEREKREKAG